MDSVFTPGSSHHEIVPLPKVTTTTQNERVWSEGRAFIMTVSPYKKELEAEIQKKNDKELTQQRGAKREKPKRNHQLYHPDNYLKKAKIKQQTTRQAKAGPF